MALSMDAINLSNKQSLHANDSLKKDDQLFAPTKPKNDSFCHSQTANLNLFYINKIGNKTVFFLFRIMVNLILILSPKAFASIFIV